MCNACSPYRCLVVTRVSEDSKEATVRVRLKTKRHVLDPHQGMELAYDTENWVNIKFNPALKHLLLHLNTIVRCNAPDER